MNIMNMVTRMVLRKFINMGINKGMGMASKAHRQHKSRKNHGDPMADEIWDGKEDAQPVKRNRGKNRR